MHAVLPRNTSRRSFRLSLSIIFSAADRSGSGETIPTGQTPLHLYTLQPWTRRHSVVPHPSFHTPSNQIKTLNHNKLLECGDYHQLMILYELRALCAFSSADVCHLQPLSVHTLPVIFAFLWGAAAIFIYLFIFSPQIFWLLWVVFSRKRKGEVEKKWNKKIKKSIWTETTALNKRNTFEVCLLICSLLHWSLVM